MSYQSRAISPLQQERLSYQPKLAGVLSQGINNIKLNLLEATEAVADKEEIKNLFPEVYGRPIAKFSNEGAELSNEQKNVGVILSGGQAPGGHNVIAGLFDALKTANPENKLYGFLGGPSGIVDGEYIELTEDKINQYRNTGGFDIIGSGRTKLETEAQFAKALDVCRKLNIKAIAIIGGDDSNTNA